MIYNEIAYFMNKFELFDRNIEQRDTNMTEQ